MLHFVRIVHCDLWAGLTAATPLCEEHDTSPKDPSKELDTAWKCWITSNAGKFKRLLNCIANNASGRCAENGEKAPITAAVKQSKLVSKVSNTKVLELFCLSIKYKLVQNLFLCDFTFSTQSPLTKPKLNCNKCPPKLWVHNPFCEWKVKSTSSN